MEPSKQQEEILGLGRKLVAQLGPESSHDLLAHWLCYHLADLMNKAESADGDSKIEVQRECVETILKVWERRASATHSIQPLADLQPAVELLYAISSADDHSWEAYMFRGKDPWHKAGATIYETSQLMTGLLFFQLTRDADWTNLASWKKEQEAMLATEEGRLIEGIEKIVDRVTLYYGLDKKPEIKSNSGKVIVEKLRDAIAQQIAAVDAIEKQLDMSKDPPTGYSRSILDEYEED